MSGSLETSKMRVDNEICIGNNCGTTEGDDAVAYGSTEDSSMDGPLYVDQIVADGSLCIAGTGQNC
jgi:hypothetical protein